MGHAKRIALTTAGSVLLVTGLALLVLPGPGLLLVLAGMVLLSRAIPSLARHVEPIRNRALKAAEDSVSSWWRVAGSVLAGLGLVGAGVVLGVVRELPFPGLRDLPVTGWGTGGSLIVSGLLLFALLVWSRKRVRAAAVVPPAPETAAQPSKITA